MAKVKRGPSSKGEDIRQYSAGYEFEGEQVESVLTVPIWKFSKDDPRRTFELKGFKDIESKDHPGKKFRTYHGIDLKTGQEFSFAPGGLFDYIVKENNIVNGDRLGVEFQGQVEIDSGRANQWRIVRLKKPSTVA